MIVPLPPQRVLIVDDNALNRLLLKTLLAPEGYELAVAAHAQQALIAVTAFKPDLILMDLELPGMDGLTLARQLKRDPNTRDIRIVVLTAHSAADVEARVRAAGCEGFLAKPVDPGTFCKTVRSWLSP